MALFRPTRRELIGSLPLLAGAAALPGPLGASPFASPPFNFLVVGDWGRNGSPNQRLVADRMGKLAERTASRFTISTGDNFYTFGVSSKTDSQWDRSFTDVYTSEALQRPWYAVLGNHDYGGNVQAQIDRSGTGPWVMDDLWYERTPEQIGHPDVHLFFINTVVWLGKEAFPFKWLGSDIEKGDRERQIDWLTRRLGESAARFKFVFGHHGIYSIGPHGGKMRMRELDDVLRKYRVTAYVNGHDHCLYHISRDGLHYICSGAGSQVLADYKGGPVFPDPAGGPATGCVLPVFCDPKGAEVFPYWHYHLAAPGFAAFEIGPSGPSFQFHGRAGASYEYVWP
jgi:tartrate-resistant acid phosphatase type 5